MPSELTMLLDKLERDHSLPLSAYEELIFAAWDKPDEELASYAAGKADRLRREIFGNKVYIRGLVEVTNFCKNDCLYCGIRRSNRKCERYRLETPTIESCARQGYELGFRTFVLQGGEDPLLTDDVLCEMIRSLKQDFPECAVTLSFGERSRESYARLREAGAERYLLRHETADRAHYESIHPAEMSFDNRMRCAEDLRDLGFIVGLGFMVGSPGQTPATIAQDLKLIEQFRPEMCGIGPFVPHKDTPFASEPGGTVALTTYCLSLIRLILPEVLLPATTALATIDPAGRKRGLCAGANVVMPNLSPADVRDKYTLYDNKANTGTEAAEGLEELKRETASVGYHVVIDRGDPPRQIDGKHKEAIS